MHKNTSALFGALAVTMPFIGGIPAQSLPPKPPQDISEAYIPAVGTVTKSVLSNGLTVLSVPSSASDLVTLDAWVGAGTRRETPDISGAAHFMEHLIFKGTPTRKPGQIDRDIENLGGTFNASTSYDWAHFYVTVSSADAEAALSILSDALMNADLDQQSIEVERPVILNEMAQELSSPSTVVERKFNQLLFGDQAYGRPLLGTDTIVAQIPRSTLMKFYKTYYVPSNVTLVVSGHVAKDRALKMAQASLGNWSGKPAPDDQPLSPVNPVHQVTQTVPGQGPSAYVLVGFEAPSVSVRPDAYAMDVLLTLLGQGGNNRLKTDLVIKSKKATSISANYLTQKDPGSLTITAACSPGNVGTVTSSILAEVSDLRDQLVPVGELDAAKHALLSSYLFDVQTTQGRADALGFYSVIDSYAYDVDYIKNFEGVTAMDVQKAAMKYLDPQNCIVVDSIPPTDPSLASLDSPEQHLASAKVAR